MSISSGSCSFVTVSPFHERHLAEGTRVTLSQFNKRLCAFKRRRRASLREKEEEKEKEKKKKKKEKEKKKKEKGEGNGEKERRKRRRRTQIGGRILNVCF